MYFTWCFNKFIKSNQHYSSEATVLQLAKKFLSPTKRWLTTPRSKWSSGGGMMLTTVVWSSSGSIGSLTKLLWSLLSSGLRTCRKECLDEVNQKFLARHNQKKLQGCFDEWAWIPQSKFATLIWKHSFLSNCVKTNSAGVIILYNKQYDLVHKYADIEGRQLVAVMRWWEKVYCCERLFSKWQ